MSETGNGFALRVPFKAVARNYIEDSVGTVADVGAVAATLHFEVVDVFGVDLRAEITRDVGVWDLHAVDLPADLVTAAHVKHVVCDICAGNEVGDHLQAVGAICSGCPGDVDAVDQGGRRDGVHICGLGLTGHGD